MATVISNQKVTSDFHLMWLDSSYIAAKAKPGQFVMVYCGENTLLRRPISIHQRNDSKIALLFQVTGKGTEWLSKCKADDNIDLLGPLGNGFSIHPETHKLLLVGGGIGIAPLVFPAQESSQRNYEVVMLAGVRAAGQINFKSHLPAEIKSIYVAEDGSLLRKGLVTEFIPEYIDWADQVFTCGPLPMYKAMTQMPEIKDKPVQVSLEVRMGCGRGVCYGCTVKTKDGLKQVCIDGPVFDLDDIIWDEVAY
jgi:dihydroorotate dehydrogenase electron transfer subunit